MIALFNAFGMSLINTIEKLAPLPVLLTGGTGWGKSVLAREIADRRKFGFIQFNAHPGMDISLLVGMWRPQPVNNGVTISWEDGLITRSARTGQTLLLEEITRAPQEAMSRLFGLMDTQNRYWSLPEAGIPEVPIDPNFWLIATANIGQGYYVSRLDDALARRFAAIIEIAAPIADERKLLEEIVGQNTAGHVLEWVRTARYEIVPSVNTGDLLMIARSMVALSLSLKDAVTFTLHGREQYAQVTGRLEELAAVHPC